MSRPLDSMRPPEGWKPRARRRFSRRKFLAGSGIATLGTGLALAGCGGNPIPSTNPLGTNTTEEGTEAAGTQAGAASPTAAGDVAPSLTVTGFVFSDGQFDPHKTQIGALHGQQSFVYSRLLSYTDQASGDMTPDLAEEMPEQVDDRTYIFRLRPEARWHDRAPLNGRAVTSDDVRHSFERQMNGDASFVRRDRWDFIESIETPNDEHVVIRTREPFAGSLSRLAGTEAFIVPHEFDEGERSFGQNAQIGSGPFSWIEWDERSFASVARNENWYGGAPKIAGVTLVEPPDSATVEAMLRVRDLDVAFLGAPQAEGLRQNIPELRSQEIGNALFFGMRFTAPVPPFDDVRLRSAISMAIDRREMVDFFFQGAGEPNAWVSWPVKKWALSPAELSEFPGYRLGSGGRDKDIADARALIENMRSDGIDVPSKLTLHCEQTSEEQLSLGSLIARHLLAALDISVDLEALPIDELVDRHFAGEAPWIAGPDTGWLDLDDWVYPYFHSTGLQNSFALRSNRLDGLIEDQRSEFETEARRGLGRDIQRELLAVNVGVNLVSERVVALSWPYVRDFPLDIMDGYQHRFAKTWIDTADPTYRAK